MDISKIDKNFCNYYSFEGMTTHNVNEDVFTLYGLCREEGELDFKRLPHWLPPKVEGNEVVPQLYKNTSGIRVRFKTDSKRIVLKCVYEQLHKGSNMSLAGASGFDMYADGQYCSVFHPGTNTSGGYTEPINIEHGYASGYNFHDKKLRDIVINFPTYNGVEEVYIAVEEDAQLLPGDCYKHTLPVVFYGSSITQGGCASHPGNCYTHMISRHYDTDIINLGFSGGCRAEEALGEYIAQLPMSVFVFDYDHNAPTLEHLERTHYRFYQQVRAKNPELPIIMISAADRCSAEHAQRRQLIKANYERALSEGDRNVYFVDGDEIYADVGINFCLVDVAHPNDMGFWCMYKAIGPVVGKLLGE